MAKGEKTDRQLAAEERKVRRSRAKSL